MGANLARADHEAQGYPDGTTAPCVDNRGAWERAAADALCKGPGYWWRECPRSQRISGAPSVTDTFAIRRLKGPKVKSDSA